MKLKTIKLSDKTEDVFITATETDEGAIRQDASLFLLRTATTTSPAQSGNRRGCPLRAPAASRSGPAD